VVVHEREIHLPVVEPLLERGDDVVGLRGLVVDWFPAEVVGPRGGRVDGRVREQQVETNSGRGRFRGEEAGWECGGVR
jgi:hypothetical protein